MCVCVYLCVYRGGGGGGGRERGEGRGFDRGEYTTLTMYVQLKTCMSVSHAPPITSEMKGLF